MNRIRRILAGVLVCVLLFTDNTLILRADEPVSEAVLTGTELSAPAEGDTSGGSGTEGGGEAAETTLQSAKEAAVTPVPEKEGQPAPAVTEETAEPTPTPAVTEETAEPTPTPAVTEESAEPTPTPAPTGETAEPTPAPAPTGETAEPSPTPAPTEEAAEPVPSPSPSPAEEAAKPVPSSSPEAGASDASVSGEMLQQVTGTAEGKEGESESSELLSSKDPDGFVEGEVALENTEETDLIPAGNIEWNTKTDGNIRAEFTLPYDREKLGEYRQYKLVLIEYAADDSTGTEVADFNDTIGDLIGEEDPANFRFNGEDYYTFSIDFSKILRNLKKSADYSYKLSFTYEGRTLESRESERLTFVYEADKLDNPSGLKWETDRNEFTGYASWNPVENATGYLVVLYLDEKAVKTLELKPEETTALLIENARGLNITELEGYTFSVVAVGNGKYADSDEIRSGSISMILSTPGGLAWVGTVARWDPVDNARYYVVRLLRRKKSERDNNKKTGVELKKVQVTSDEGCRYDFLSQLKKLTDKDIRTYDYFFEVTACPDEKTPYKQSVTAQSDPYKTSDSISNLEWATDTGEVSFIVNDYYGEYRLVFFRGGTKLGTEELGNLQGKLTDGVFYFPGDKYLTKDGQYEVRAVDTRTGKYLSASMKFKEPSKSNRITAPKIKKSIGSATRIEWKPSKHTETGTGVTYEIRLYDKSRYTELRTVYCYYELADEVLRTGCRKVKVRAISDNLQVIGSSDWSNEVTLTPDSKVINLSGECGSNATYMLSGKKGNLKLVIEGYGDMYDYGDPSLSTSEVTAPWAEFAGQIKSIKLSADLTSIGSCAFYGCKSVSSIVLPGALTRIGNYAFSGCKSLSGPLVIPEGVTKIGEGAFKQAKKLSTVMFEGGTEPEITAYSKKTNNGSFPKKVKISINSNKYWEGTKNRNKWEGYELYTKEVKADKVILSESVCNLDHDESVKLTAELSPSYAKNQKIIWKSSDNSIVSVNDSGRVTAHKKNGVAVVSAVSASNKKAKATCTFIIGQKNVWIKKGSDLYYNKKSGETAAGWAKATIYGDKNNTKKYYQFFDRTSGKRKTGWLDDGGFRYYLKSDGRVTTGYTKVAGKWYCFNDDENLTPETGYGAIKTGWDAPGYEHYFMPVSGEAVTGWHQIDGRWYFFDQNGNKKTGLQKIDGRLYYLKDSIDESKGETAVNLGSKEYGEIVVDGKHYLLTGMDSSRRNEALNGMAVTGWYKDTQYFDPGTGVRASGFYEVKTINKTEYYYFDEATGNKVVNDTRSVGGQTFRFGENGLLVTGGVSGTKKKLYDYDSNGKLQEKREVIKYDGRFFYNDGDSFELVTGIVNINGKERFYDQNGLLPEETVFVASDRHTITDDPAEITYCFSRTGRRTGWIKDYSRNKYYFDTKTGEKYTGYRLVGKTWYNFGDDGVLGDGLKKGHATVTSLNSGSKGKSYNMITEYNKSGKLVTGWHTKKGYYPTGLFEVSSDDLDDDRVMYLKNGVPQTGWVSASGVRKNATVKLYLDPHSGDLAIGRKKIGGKRYYFYTEADEDANNGKVIAGELASSVWLSNPEVDGSGANKVYASVPGNLDNTLRTFRYVNKDGTWKSGWLTITKDNKKIHYYFDPKPSDPAARLSLARSTRVQNGKYYVDAYGRRR